jgi:hypothetical protein
MGIGCSASATARTNPLRKSEFRERFQRDLPLQGLGKPNALRVSRTPANSGLKASSRSAATTRIDPARARYGSRPRIRQHLACYGSKTGPNHGSNRLVKAVSDRAFSGEAKLCRIGTRLGRLSPQPKQRHIGVHG